MNELIKIRKSAGGKQVVSARDLHQFLDAGSNVNTWLKNQADRCMLEEGKDFVQIREESTGGRPSVDYALTINSAKEISMMNGGDKGKEARLYFIECEKQLQAIHSIPQSFSDALLLAANQAKLIEDKQKEINALAPKASFYDSVADSKDALTMEEAAKVLNQGGRNKLFSFLRDKKVLMPAPKNLPYQRFIDAGYFRVIEVPYERKGETHITPKVLVHQKGIAYINHLLKQAA